MTYDAMAEAAKLVQFCHGASHSLTLSQGDEVRLVAAALETARAAGREEALEEAAITAHGMPSGTIDAEQIRALK